MKILKAGQSVLSDVEKSIYSYNHAIATLNTKCEEIVGTKTGVIDVRSVGSNPLNKSSEAVTNCASYGPPNSATYEAGSFNNVLLDSDTNYETDFNRLKNIAFRTSNNIQSYWLASRYVEDTQNQSFQIKKVDEDGSILNCLIFYISSSVGGNSVISYNLGEGVRPVLTLDANVLSNASGSGTSLDPFIIQ